MGFSCGCDDSDYETVSDDFQAATEPGVCIECKAEIKPGDTEYVYKMAYYHEDGPLDELSDEKLAEWLAPDGDGEMVTYRHCEKCGDLSLSVASLGFCYAFGSLLEAHRDYVDELNY